MGEKAKDAPVKEAPKKKEKKAAMKIDNKQLFTLDQPEEPVVEYVDDTPASWEMPAGSFDNQGYPSKSDAAPAVKPAPQKTETEAAPKPVRVSATAKPKAKAPTTSGGPSMAEIMKEERLAEAARKLEEKRRLAQEKKEREGEKPKAEPKKKDKKKGMK